jgi:hypothetical protein
MLREQWSAHSAHRHSVARGLEPVTCDEAIALESQRNAGARERMAADPSHNSWADRYSSSVRRGQYVDRLELFFGLLGRDNVHVLFSERFAENPEPEYALVLHFLDLPVHLPRAGFGRWNASPPAATGVQARRLLEQHYAPHDDRLEALLGETLLWRQAPRKTEPAGPHLLP